MITLVYGKGKTVYIRKLLNLSDKFSVQLCGAIQRNDVVVLDKPEVYLPPAQVLELTQMLVDSGKTYIIETYSEHMCLRLLKLIRTEKLKPDQVRIVWCYGDGSTIDIKIDEDGDFIDCWPEGFFNERAGELFSD